MVKLIIFDLDGTLLNTIDDLADCTNFVLQKHGFPTHKIDTYKYFVGNGIAMLVQRALPKEVAKDTFLTVLHDFKQYYEIHKEDKTTPYEGMVETLEALQEKGILLAVATNKSHELLPDLMHHYFSTIKWAAVFGNRNEVPIKPHPQIVYDILEHIRNSSNEASPISIHEILYIGDTAVDMQTAQNAGITKIGALWGFRLKEELENANADYLIENPKELIFMV